MSGRRLGSAALALLLAAACGGEPPPDDLKYPDHGLLILSLDTLRADRLGIYGNTRGLTPELDAFAQECVIFDDAYANSPKTASSHMTLFTSMLPTAHGVTNYSPRQGIDPRMLADNRLTLGQVLRRAGYWNATLASGGNIQDVLGFAKGFGNYFSTAMRDVSNLVTEAEVVFDQARRQSAPWFVFMHTYQVHAPYVPPEPYMSRFATRREGLVSEFVDRLSKLPPQEQWRAMNDLWDRKDELTAEDAHYLSELYDGEVAYTDAVLGDFFDFLRDKELLDQMIVVVLSDHGEEFAEHGDYEHDQLYAEHLHVPLLIRLPHGHFGGERVRGLTGLIDVMPTLLEMLDLRGPTGQMQGTSLVPAILSGRTQNQPVIAEAVMYPDRYQGALRSETASVIFRAAPGTLEGYDLRQDPDEQTDVATSAPWFGPAAGSLEQSLKVVFAQRETLDKEATGELSPLSPEQRQQLIALGYIGEDEEAVAAPPPEGSPLESWPRAWLEQLRKQP